MKKILNIAVMISLLSFFVACSDSKVDSGITNTPLPAPIEESPARSEITYNPVTMKTATERSFSDFSSFKAAVEKGQFVREDNWCWNENVKYTMQAYETEVSEGTFLIFNTSTSKMVKTEKFDRVIDDGAVDYQFDENGGMEYDHLGVIKKLIVILDDATMYRAENYNKTVFTILTSENITYTIDLNRPLIGNPVAAYDAEYATGYYTYSSGCLY